MFGRGRRVLPLRPGELLPGAEEITPSGKGQAGRGPFNPCLCLGWSLGHLYVPLCQLETKLGKKVRPSWRLPLGEMVTTVCQIRVCAKGETARNAQEWTAGKPRLPAGKTRLRITEGSHSQQTEQYRVPPYEGEGVHVLKEEKRTVTVPRTRWAGRWKR